MKQITAKKVTYWLLGETAGRTSVAIWKHLWGMPVEGGGKIAQKVAQESIASMQEAIARLSTAVAKVVSTYNLAQEQYNHKLKEHQEAEQQAQLAHSKGNEDAARLAITRAISLERVLPQLKERVEAAEITASKAKAKLKRETEKLEAYKLELQNLASLTLVNQAMAEISGISDEWGIDSARSHFTEAKNQIENKALFEEAKAELVENPSELLADEIDALALNAEIENRFSKLISHSES